MLYNLKVRSIYIISLIPLLLFPNNILTAQNNPYKIKDGLYGIMRLALKTDKRNKRFYELSDSLIHESKRCNDIKAQCIGQYFKVQYYTNAIPNDEKATLKQLSYAKDFIIKTPYLQYYFSSWSSYIILLLNHEKYDKALTEIEQYQKDALKMNNSYGISFSYKNMGHIYTALKNHHMALEQYLQGEKYLESSKNYTEIYSLQLDIANSYNIMGNNDKAFEYYNKALKNCSTDNRKHPILSQLLRLSIEMNKSEDIIDSYYKKWISLEKNFGKTLLDRQILTYYAYYNYKGKVTTSLSNKTTC